MATRKNSRAAAEAGTTALFDVLSNLSHDNEDYAPGDQVELTEAQALALGPLVVKPAASAADAS